MKYASDFRQIARESLVGKWTVAVFAGIISALLGAGEENMVNVSFRDGEFVDLSVFGQEILSAGVVQQLFMGMTFFALGLVVLSLIVGSVVEVGYARFNLELVDRQKVPELRTLFDYFSHWGTAVVARLLRSLYVLLWSLLLFFPGIIASYSYAMTSFILAEHPEMSASEAIRRSKEMMEGNRFRLFCLQLSFIGWSLLCLFTLGIGSLWLRPYMQAATAAFYRDVSAAAPEEN